MNASNFYPYQAHAVKHVIDNPESGLFLGLGLGKTVISLTALDYLMFQELEISCPLIIGPKRVAEHVWSSEIAKWDHLKHLTFSKILGTESQRKQALPARTKADIYIINRENVAWLVAYYGTAFPFDMLVIDELSSFKNAKSVRFKALRQVRPKIKRVTGLTGTPAPNTLVDLWSQLYLLDQGARLSKSLGHYRETYFQSDKRNAERIFSYKPKGKDYEAAIYNKIGDICISMQAKDYLDLPERIDRIVPVYLTAEQQSRYDKFEEEQVMLMEDADEITALNAAALTGKLLQFANGAIYDAEKVPHEVHRAKLEALEELVEDAAGQPILIFYGYKHDLTRIMTVLKRFGPVALKDNDTIDAWNRGEIPVLLAHPGSAGHGLNLQGGGHIIVWFGNTWSLELYQQGVGRLDRQGQTERVVNNRLVTQGTMDERVIQALGAKDEGQSALINAVRAVVAKYR